MVPGRDLVAARPQFLAGLRVERVQHRMGRQRDAAFQAEVEPDIGKRLGGVLAAAVGEDHAVGDTGGSA